MQNVRNKAKSTLKEKFVKLVICHEKNTNQNTYYDFIENFIKKI